MKRTFVDRVTLFVVAAHKSRAQELLEGFAPSGANRAQAFARELDTWDSARRQALLAREFGAPVEATQRVARLLDSTRGELRAAIVAQLPPSLRPATLAPTPNPASPALVALAARLVREALR